MRLRRCVDRRVRAGAAGFQGHPESEELLDQVVVQHPRDGVALFTEVELLSAGLGVDQPERDPTLAGEVLRHGELSLAERVLALPAAGDDGPLLALWAVERDHEKRPGRLAGVGF